AKMRREPASALDFRGIRTAGIIGAGVAGLAAARALGAENVACRVFERHGELGGVWSIGYSNFGVQTQKELYEFPDWPLPPDTPDFTPGPLIRQYLQAYADHFGITPHVRLDAPVLALAQRGQRPGWVVSYHDGSAVRHEEFDLVAVCTGLYSGSPHEPKLPGQERFRGEVVHSSAVKDRDILRGKRVAVVGYGKSATDIAVEAAAVSPKTAIIIREPHWPIPQRIAGVLPFKWGMLHRLMSTLLPPYQRVSLLERMVHGVGRPLVWLYWRLLERLLVVQYRLGSRFGTRVDLVPRAPVEVDCFGESVMLPRPEFYRLVRRGAIDAHRAAIAEFSPTGLVLQNGTHVEADLVVLGTGWATDYAFLPGDLQAALEVEEDGLYLYRHMIHPDVPRLVFVGANASTITSITTCCLQARWLAELVRGRHRLPPREQMAQNIEEMKAWKRRFMPFSPARGARLIGHQLHYYDELLRDFGANPRRKRGWWAPLKEAIAPYESRDYRSIVSGAWERED
ncbi:MAG: flavin-containing monooxygenase, partial [Candidatus Rokuibacteriota bacterium]